MHSERWCKIFLLWKSVMGTLRPLVNAHDTTRKKKKKTCPSNGAVNIARHPRISFMSHALRVLRALLNRRVHSAPKREGGDVFRHGTGAEANDGQMGGAMECFHSERSRRRSRKQAPRRRVGRMAGPGGTLGDAG